MIKERNFGVAEARIGLSVITCLLIVFGYVVVHRLGDASSPADVESNRAQQSSQVNSMPNAPLKSPATTSEATGRYGEAIQQSANQQSAYRPQWLTPQNDSPGVSLPSLGIDDPAAQQSDWLDPSIEPLGSELRSGLMPDANQKR